MVFLLVIVGLAELDADGVTIARPLPPLQKRAQAAVKCTKRKIFAQEELNEK